jgi:PBP1b-binding outer membrane lipoprotein LpoB
MLKRIMIPLLLAFLLVACSRDAEPVETETSVPAAQPTDTAQPVQPSPAVQATATSGAIAGEIQGCTVVSVQPTPSPDEESLFAPVSDDDWTIGPEDARVTLIEYSDFQ